MYVRAVHIDTLL